MRLFHPDSKLFHYLTSMADYMLLNLCWLVCSIPIVTIGASSAAMHAVLGKMLRDEGGGVVLPFFRAFAANFKAATIYWLVHFGIFVLLVFNLWFSLRYQSTWSILAVTKWLSILLMICLQSISVFVYSQIARYENTFGVYIRNAILLVIKNPIRSLICVALFAIPFAMVWFSPALVVRMLPLWSLIGITLLYDLANRLLFPIYKELEEVQNASTT